MRFHRQSSELAYEDRQSSDLPDVRQGDPRKETTSNRVACAFSCLRTKTDWARISLAKKQHSTGWFILFLVCVWRPTELGAVRRPTELGSPWRPPGRSSHKNNNQLGGLCFFQSLRTKRSCFRMCQQLLCFASHIFFSHPFHHLLLAANLGARIFFSHPFHHCWRQIWERVSFFSHPFHHLLLAANLGVNYL